MHQIVKIFPQTWTEKWKYILNKNCILNADQVGSLTCHPLQVKTSSIWHYDFCVMTCHSHRIDIPHLPSTSFWPIHCWNTEDFRLLIFSHPFTTTAYFSQSIATFNSDYKKGNDHFRNSTIVLLITTAVSINLHEILIVWLCVN